MRKLLAAAAALLGFAGSASPAPACSVRPDYVRPTNYELVQLADAIVIAAAGDPASQDRLTFSVAEPLKGSAPDRLPLRRAVLRPVLPSNLDDLSSSHREGHAGPCNRMSFAKGASYVLFLARSADGQWMQLQYPFSRINEDYAGEATPWMRSVRRYVRLQKRLAPMQQLEALERMVATGRDDRGEELRLAEIEDIRDHLSSLSPYKPTAYLLQAYAAASSGRAPKHGMRPRTADLEQSRAQLATRALFGDLNPPPLRAEQPEGRILAALATGDHPGARPLFARLLRERPSDPVAVGNALRFQARHGRFPEAFRWIESHLMNLLPRLDGREALWLIGQVAHVQWGDYRDKGEERWRSDPHAASAWPELALSLYWYQRGRFGRSGIYELRDAVETLRPANPRDRPLVALALAADWTDPVQDWAAEQIRDDPLRRSWEALPPELREAREDPAWLPLRIVLAAGHFLDDGTLPAVFCQSPQRRRLLIAALGGDIDRQHHRLLARIAATPGLASEDRKLLSASAAKASASIRSGREVDPLLGGGQSDLDVLAHIATGATVQAEPILCPR